MKQSEEKTSSLNVFQRVNLIMKDLTYIQKGDKKVNGQYRFVSHDQVTGAVRPHLIAHGVCPVPSVVEVTQDGNRTQVTMDTTFINVDAPDDRYTVRTFGYAVDKGDKGPGIAMSYAYKYAFLKAFCLETGDDPDNNANSVYEATPQPKKTQVVQTLSPEQMNELERIFTKYPEYRENVTKALQGKPLTQLPLDAFTKIRTIAKERHQEEGQTKKIVELQF